MNKKGFLLGEETVKIIIAVIAILFLILFAVYLYNNYAQDKDLTNAKDSLNHLVSEIAAGSQQVQIYNPSSPWFIASFPQPIKTSYTSQPQNVIPKKCSSVGWASCLCICKETSITNSGGPSVGQLCDNYGVCQQSSYSVGTSNHDILITNPPLLLSINYQTKTIQQNGP